MQPLTPALEDLLEHLEDLDRRLRPLRAGEDAAPTGNLLLLKPVLAEIYDQVDALIAGIRSIDAAYQRYRDRFFHLPAICLCTGADSIVLEANRAAALLFGIAPDRLQGSPLGAHLHPESIPAFRSAVAALGRGDDLPAQEFLLVRADGGTVPATAAVSTSYGPGGRAAEYLWVFHDISGEKRVEEALRESEDRYRELTENVSDAFLALDRDGRVLSWNRVAARLSGRTVEEAVGQSIYDLFPQLRNDEVIGFFRQIAETGRPGVSECRFDLHGREHAFEVRAVPTRAGVSVYIRDITARREAEVALRRSEERCRMVVESQTELICRRLPDGTITFANDAYCRYLGIPCGDLIGRRYALTVPPDDQARIQESLASLTPDHPVSTVEHRVIMPDGRVRWQQWTNTASFDDEGSAAEYQSVGRDITDARMAGEALLLANRKLNLLSDVTRHDILNRLNVLSGYLDLFRERVSDPEMLEYCRKEEEAIRDIRHYMAFTAEYRDVGVAAPAWQDVRRIVREAAAGLDPGPVAVEVRTRDLEVYADPLIVRVFENLIDNSLRHGERVTRIRIYPEESGRGISLVYEDDGIGIPHAAKENLFERGFGRQTGFGLFLSREILGITDLSIRETGEPGKGVRFEIDVPPGFYRFTGRVQVR
ncbi:MULTISPECIES: PAS domain S-box protein [Methanoculleus]|uniref:histidine kinase n=2 Tax=Methanoculleus TaxID=45989 RepID=A3CX07_METMJ|nr:MULTISPECIES: PAS domain S-box protein [Methanoculleus]ABN57907.1 PAS/PAC sensor signal transduction histidine kinase [Methanoculleus marisnigri JR1]UYU19292.1 PAS domain S-box protein [Methanoculleus submarinus]